MKSLNKNTVFRVKKFICPILPIHVASLSSQATAQNQSRSSGWATAFVVGSATLAAFTSVVHAGGNESGLEEKTYSGHDFNGALRKRILEIQTKIEQGAKDDDKFEFPLLSSHQSGDQYRFRLTASTSSPSSSAQNLEQMFSKGSAAKTLKPEQGSIGQLMRTVLQGFIKNHDVGADLLYFEGKPWLVFSRISQDASEVHLWLDAFSGKFDLIMKGKSFSERDLNIFAEAYFSLTRNHSKIIEALRELGVRVYTPTEDGLTWDALGGYHEVRQEIQNTVLLPLQYPEVFEKVNKSSRAGKQSKKSNMIRAILFEGPPGTGKTTTARILANVSNIPLLYIPVEAVLSKWFGESENIMGKIFEEASKLNGCIIFLDEIDSLGTSRDSMYVHESSKRILSVLLQRIDGFESEGRKIMVIGATNRKADLDPALQSRFDVSVQFPSPQRAERQEIFKVHAAHLANDTLTLKKLAERTESMSGRDIRDICSQAERDWSAHLILSAKFENPKNITAPPAEYYKIAVEKKRKSKEILET